MNTTRLTCLLTKTQTSNIRATVWQFIEGQQFHVTSMYLYDGSAAT